MKTAWSEILAPWMKIGTRGSPLALAQAHETRRRLALVHGAPEEHFEIVVIKTSGDMIQDRPLSEVGGKGLFTKELDLAQLDGAIDIAVHSAKDLPTMLPEGLVVAGYLPREDVRDAFIGGAAKTLMDLPQGARVGSASLRRQAMIRRLRPDLQVELLRGNVQTRLRKVESGEFAATLLALAGLKRLGLADKATSILPLDLFPPACGQGAIAHHRADGRRAIGADLAPICDAETGYALAAERAFLNVLDGSCRTPIAGHAVVAGDRAGLLRAGPAQGRLRGLRRPRRRPGRGRRRPGRKRGAENSRRRARRSAAFLTAMRVLVTRPSDQAARTAKRLAALGHEAWIAPALEIFPTGAPVPDGPFELVVATSAQAFAGWTAPHALQRAPAACVGEKTAQAARGAGLAVELVAPRAETLAEWLIAPQETRHRALSGGPGAQARAGAAPWRSRLAA